MRMMRQGVNVRPLFVVLFALLAAQVGRTQQLTVSPTYGPWYTDAFQITGLYVCATGATPDDAIGELVAQLNAVSTTGTYSRGRACTIDPPNMEEGDEIA